MFRLTILLGLVCVGIASTIPTVDDRIVGGIAVNIEQYPFQVSLQLDGRHFCGGSLYNTTIVITAAHCAAAVASYSTSRIKVGLGSKYWSQGTLKGVSKIRIHPSFDQTTMVNDVALVKLSSPVTYNTTIRNITLAKAAPVNNTVVQVSGWGTLQSGSTTLPSVLQAVTLRLITKSLCAAKPYLYGTSVTNTMVCAAAVNKDSCQGDSGGPLVANNTLVGIVSWGNGCALVGYPGVYSDVFALRTWITTNAKLM